MRNSIYSITLDEALTAVGGHHKYQSRVLAVGAAVCAAVGASASSIVFLLQPAISEFDGKCTACAAWDWQTSYSLTALSVLYLLGAAFSTLLLSGLESCFGRRKTLLISAYVGLLAGLMACGTPFLWILFVAMPLKGAADAAGVIVSVLGMVEVSDGDFRSWYVAGLAAAAYCGYALTYTVSLVVPEWRVVCLLPTVLWCACIPLTSMILESPRYMAAIRGKYLLARSVLHDISQVNKKAPFNDMLEGEKVIGYQENDKEHEEGHLSNSSTRDATGKLVFVPITKGIVSVSQGETHHMKRFYHWHLAALSSTRGVFVVSLMTWLSVALTLRSLWTVPGDDIPVVAYLMWLGDLLVLALSSYLANHMGRLGMNITYLAVVGLSAILTIAFISPTCHPEGLCLLERVVEVILLHTARVVMKVEVFILGLYTMESFPTVIRFLAVGLLASLSTVLWLVTPLLTLLLQTGNVSILLLCGVASLVCSIISCLLTDTDLEELLDYVEEEKKEMNKPAELSQIEIHPSSAEDTSRRLKSGGQVPFQVIAEEQT